VARSRQQQSARSEMSFLALLVVPAWLAHDIRPELARSKISKTSPAAQRWQGWALKGSPCQPCIIRSSLVLAACLRSSSSDFQLQPAGWRTSWSGPPSHPMPPAHSCQERPLLPWKENSCVASGTQVECRVRLALKAGNHERASKTSNILSNMDAGLSTSQPARRMPFWRN
jgi:hypothetical protein